MRRTAKLRDLQRERDHALVRAVQLEAQLREASETIERLRRDSAAAQAAVERVVDNALFAAGAAPVFHPEDARFQPRTREQQAADQQAAERRQPLSPAAWRRRAEQLESESAERDRKAALVEELRREALLRKEAAAREREAAAEPPA